MKKNNITPKHKTGISKFYKRPVAYQEFRAGGGFVLENSVIRIYRFTVNFDIFREAIIN